MSGRCSLNDMIAKTFQVELFAAHPIHQATLARTNGVDGGGNLLFVSTRHGDETVFVPMQNVPRRNRHAVNLNGHAPAHDVEINVAHHGAARKILESQGANLRDVAPWRWRMVDITSPQCAA